MRGSAVWEIVEQKQRERAQNTDAIVFQYELPLAFKNEQDHIWKVSPLNSFSMLCPNLSSLSVQSQRAFILLS